MSGPGGAVLRAVMASVQAAVAVIDDAGRVVKANERWLAVGPPPGADWRGIVHPADRHLAPAQPGPPVEVRVRLSGGASRWFSVVLERVDGEGRAAVALTDVDEIRRTAVERAALRRIAGGVTRADDPGGLLAQVAEEVGLLVSADGAGVVQFDGSRAARMVGRWAADPTLYAMAPDELPLEGSGTTAQVYATGRPCRVDYAARLGPGETLPHPWSASVAVPIRVESRLWGALGAVALHGTRLTEDAEERLSHFAELVGLAIANSEAREQLMLQARTDPLTGLAHHGTFHRALAEEIARTARFGHALSLAVIDIDHFKTVNDEHGHEVGDAALRAIAGRLCDHARVVDLAARVGGEEFAWLMPGTPLSGAEAAAERFRSAVAGERFGPVPVVTVSVGVAQLDPGDHDGSALFRRADGALYAAKAAGRDRTMAAEST